MNRFLNERIQKFSYNVTVDGGTDNTAYTLGTLPANILITGGFASVRTNFDDGADESTTVSLGYTGAATAFMAAKAGSALNTAQNVTLLPGVPGLDSGQANITDISDQTAAVIATNTAASYIELTANKNVILTLSDDTDFTAGAIDVYIKYIQL